MSYRGRRRGAGERIAAWIHRGEGREWAADMLATLDVVDTDEKLKELDRWVDDTKHLLAHDFGRTFSLIYPWLVIALIGLVLGLRARAAARSGSEGSADADRAVG
jgi:hypothetical protein